MIDAIMKEWQNISEFEILQLVDSMTGRIAAIIAANGGHTHW